MSSPTKPANTPTRILYLCEFCMDNCPEGSCWERKDLRVLPTGVWVCDGCFHDGNCRDLGLPDDEDDVKPKWASLPLPPEYLPVNAHAYLIAALKAIVDIDRSTVRRVLGPNEAPHQGMINLKKIGDIANAALKQAGDGNG